MATSGTRKLWLYLIEILKLYLEDVNAFSTGGVAVSDRKLALKYSLRRKNWIITQGDLLKASQFLLGMLFLSE